LPHPRILDPDSRGRVNPHPQESTSMKSWAPSGTKLGLSAGVALSLVLWIVLAGATAPSKSTPKLQPDKLVILSTTDVKGKTSPCG
jgi:hypothetical protein